MDNCDGGNDGGAITITGYHFELAGDINVNDDTASNFGGRRGGGRVKDFYNGTYNNTGTITVTEGICGGLAVSTAPGMDGMPETMMDSLTATMTQAIVALGTQMSNPCGPGAIPEDFAKGSF